MKVTLFVFSLFLLTAAAAGAADYSFQFSGGSAYNFRTPLAINQSGEDRIKFDARYKTRPFQDTPYYDVRIGRWDKETGWELELLHHKLYLVNAPAEIQHFELSHGFNLLTINRVLLDQGFIYRMGLGAVIAYPDSVTIRGRTGSGGYQLAGSCAQIGMEKRFSLSKEFFASIEGKLTAAYADVDIDGGEARVRNIAAHGLFGIGFRF